ncbi:MAG: glycosyltransferase family 4 protein, partial [Vicinamibacterales bacterium]
MFALHIDTARTWRGGQHQVLLTVLGLRAAGHRAVLVAHPAGELYRRAREGPDLVPLAPRSEIDLTAAWRLSRIIRQWKPAIVHAHDPHAVAMAALALSFGAPVPRPWLVAARRVDFHLQGNSFSRWKYRQVDAFIAASGAIQAILRHDGIAAVRVVVVHDGFDGDSVQRLPAVDVHGE